jgi:hypothetical protein
MILRRVIAHFRKQEWTAIALDFVIVVAGILIAFQITTWNEDRATRASERDYLERLHSDVLELTDRRAYYDRDRPLIVKTLELLTDFANGYRDDPSEAKAYVLKEIPALEQRPDVLDSYLCNFIDWSSMLTLPPSELPTATELISAGRVDRIASKEVKLALLSYLQQARRSQEFTSAQILQTTNIPAEFPDLFQIRYLLGVDLAMEEGESIPAYVCDYDQMRENNAFLNALNRNRSVYTEYFRRGVAPASERLALLHAAIDEALGVAHAADAQSAP